ncbi:glycoside hydrolase family 3 protein [Altericroceibacterium xinjiangense]|uniref:glycoside hydrolase family 3 protein n=1 Tax=Altericroceibacterium xinjiangense TaxID=762261 RepID=UPI001F4A0451|nr:glycoside hydrolase family 3 N-terminal domain-containing protein [Altericroceibacterium xinjiangense]
MTLHDDGSAGKTGPGMISRYNEVERHVVRSMMKSLAAGAALLALGACAQGAEPAIGAGPLAPQPELGARAKPLVSADGLRFRDLNRDGVLNPYEDWRLSAEQRAGDLVTHMTVAEKVGTLMHSTLPGAGGVLGRADGYDLEALGDLVRDKHVTSFITRLTLAPADLAEQNNAVQELAETSRLGIPLTISTDPRSHFQYVLGAAESGTGTTQWPELLGFAALRDPELVRRFGDIARKEYRAVGIHMALSPQLDLATEPRWGRTSGTFGSDAALTSVLGGAYVAGLQGGADGLEENGVATVIKHWVGYGAEPEGFDAHNYYGRFARPGSALGMHVAAFEGALEAEAAGLMPAYPILAGATLEGEPIEEVSPGFSRQLLTDVLRKRLGYEGIVLSDWAITRDCNERCRAPTAEAPQRPQDISTAWGVENLTVRERYVKGLQAGLDQFGGVDEVAPLIAAVDEGEITESRLDESVRRVLLPKFQLGLFENPYVDPQRASAVIATPEDLALAAQVQREAQVLLQDSGGTLPFGPGRKVWLFGMAPEAAQAAGLAVVDDPAQADFAIVRAETASEMLHPNHFFGSRYKEGRLDFRDGDPAYEALKQASAHVPTALAIFLDRPAILTGVQDKAAVILGNFGASDAAVLDVLLGKAAARGTLPFELPRSMEAVERQDPGLPDDSVDPLYPRGAGIVSR